MKNLIRFLLLCAIATTFALPAFAQTPTASPSGAAAQGDDQAKRDLYECFRTNYKTDQKKAYDCGKEFLQKYPGDEYERYVKKFVDAYDKAVRKPQLIQLVKDQKWSDAYTLGKQILADEPEDLVVLYNTSLSALNLATSGNDTNNAEAVNFARKTIQLIEGGKTFEQGKPIDPKDKNEVLGLLNYALATFTFKSNPDDAITSLIKAAQYEGSIKKNPQTYGFLAVAYQAGPYNRLRTDYEKRFPAGSVETEESKVATQNINQVIDRIIDAYARAVALAGNDAALAQRKNEWMEQLTGFYKYRHNNSDAGLKEMIAGIQNTPLPQPPTLATAPAAPATGTGGASTPSPTTTPAATSDTTSATPAQPNNPSGTPATSTTPAQPSSRPTTTTPAKPTQPGNKATTPSGSTNGTRRP